LRMANPIARSHSAQDRVFGETAVSSLCHRDDAVLHGKNLGNLHAPPQRATLFWFRGLESCRLACVKCRPIVTIGHWSAVADQRLRLTLVQPDVAADIAELNTTLTS